MALKIKEHPNCKVCPLRGRKGVLGQGREDADIILLSEYPNREEVTRGSPFIGRNGKMLDGALASLSASRDDCYVTNAVKCNPEGNKLPKPSEKKGIQDPIKLCRVFIEDEIARIKPKVVAPFGNTALKSIENIEGITIREGTTKNMGSYLSVPSLHPSYIFNKGASLYYKEKFRRSLDRTLICAGAKSSDLIPEARRYTLINNMGMLEDWIDHITEAGVERMAFDLECPNLRVDEPELGIGFAYGVGKAVYIPLIKSLFIQRRSLSAGKARPILKPFWGDKQAEVLERISWLLTSGEFMLTTQNGMFELTKLLNKDNYPDVDMDFSDNWLFDSRYSAFLLNENDHNGLEALTWYPDLAGFKNKTKGSKDFSQIPLGDLSERCMSDCDATYRLTMEQAPQIKEKDLGFMMYDWMIPVCIALSHMQANGIKVDQEYTTGLAEENQKLLDDIDAKLQVYPEVKKLRRDLGEPINFNSDPQLSKLLYGNCKIPIPLIPVKGGEMKPAKGVNGEGLVNKHALAAIKNAHPIVPLLKDRSGYAHKVSALQGYVDKLYPNGRMHTNFKIPVARTGRLASGKDKEEEAQYGQESMATNLQNISRDKKMRRIIIPEDGFSFVHLDVAQAEIYWWGVLSGDPILLDAFRQGRDIHTSNLAALWKVKPHPKFGAMPYEEVMKLYKAGDEIVYEARTKIKNSVSFGVLFGMGAKTMENVYGIPEKEAGMLQQLIFKTFKRGKAYRDEMHALLHKQGFLRNPYGRYRRLPAIFSGDKGEQGGAERQGFNFLMQSTASDMNCLYIYWILEEVKARGLINDIRAVLTVHDSIILEARNEYVMEAYRIAREVTMRLPHEMCPFPPGIDFDLFHAWTTKKHIHVDNNCPDKKVYDIMGVYEDDIDPEFYCKKCAA